MITLRYEHDSYNDHIKLSWKNSNQSNYLYRVFRRKVSNSIGGNVRSDDFSPICVADINNIEDNISVLNLHPNCGDIIEFTDYVGDVREIRESEILQKWLYESSEEATSGYGLGKITVKSMAISQFNEDPQKYLYEKNVAKYDVVCIGFYDAAAYSNSNENFIPASVDILSEYISRGYGVIVGHDFLSGIFGTDKNLGPIRDLFNIKLGQSELNSHAGFDYDFEFSYEGDQVMINKSGQLMHYPWNIGTIDDVFYITKTNTLSQIASGDIWLTFLPTKIVGEGYLEDDLKVKANHYLTTYKSTAMIQAGRNLDIANIEKKIIANTIFYIKQVTNRKKHTEFMGIDDERPLAPTIIDYFTDDEDYTVTFDYRGQDVGVNLEYYVEGREVSTGEITVSNIVKPSYSSKIKCYRYKLEQIASDTPGLYKMNDWIETTERSVVSDVLRKGYYSFKIVAIDNDLNISDIKELIFFMPGLVISEPSPALTKYPNIQRINYRYRGPHESLKANNSLIQGAYNIRRLREILTELDKEKSIMLERANVSYAPPLEYRRVIEKINTAIRAKKGELYGR